MHCSYPKKNLHLCKKIKQWTTEEMLNVYLLNKNWLITHHIYTYTLYLLYLYYFFYSIYCYCYLQFLLFIFSTLFINIFFFCCTVFPTQFISLFVEKRVVFSLLLDNLTFFCLRSWEDNLARDCITHEIKVYADNTNNNNNNNNNNGKMKWKIVEII